MSACHVIIHLDRENGVFLPGEIVTGEVIVKTGEAIDCKDLTLERLWVTQGQGNAEHGELMKQSLGAGKWPAGSTERFRFRAPVPAGPVSYAGTLVNVKWLLRARADIPWARDAKGEIEFTVRPPPARELSDGTDYRSAPTKRPRTDLSLGPQYQAPSPIEPPTAAGEIIASLLSFGLGYGLWGLFRWVACSAVLVILGFMLFVQGLWKWLAWKKIGVPKVSISPTILRAGDQTHVTLMLAPRAAGTLDEVTVKLKCEEVAVSGSGKSKATQTHVCHTDSRTLASNERITRGNQVALETTITVPETAPPTFAGESNKVEWSVTVLVSVRDWPDWEHDYPLAVYPP
jgi:hypothetical protein